MPTLHKLSRKSRISLAVESFYGQVEDWSCGKPSEDDIRREAERAAKDNCVSVDFDDYGNPSFY